MIKAVVNIVPSFRSSITVLGEKKPLLLFGLAHENIQIMRTSG